MSKISRILNIEIYTRFRNTKCFISQQRETAMCRVKVKVKERRKAQAKMRMSKLGPLAMNMAIPSYAFSDIKPETYIQKKLMTSILKMTKFKRLFANNYNKFALFRSFKHGAIFSTEIESRLEKEKAHFMVPMGELAQDHKELKESTTDNEDLSDYYCFATFMPPGDCKIIVSNENIKDEDTYFC